MHSILKQINKRPLIAAPICGSSNIINLVRMTNSSGADIIELRIDSFSKPQLKKIVSLISSIKKISKLPIIATVRSPKEQGPGRGLLKLKDHERKQIYESILPLVDIIDIELSSTTINKPIIKLAHKLKKKAILSYHNFRSIPSTKELNMLVKKFKSLSGDILKIAATPRKSSDVWKFLFACSQMKKINRIFIVMGSIGTISRIIGFLFGSCLTYAYIEKTNAPGQIAIKDLVNYCRSFYRFK